MVDRKRKESIQLLIPYIDFDDNETLFNLTESNIKRINKKLK
jgi:hypothetical protein